MKKSLSICLVLLLALPLAGCFEEIVRVYEGPPVVEFEQYMQPNAPRTTNADYTSTVTYAATNVTGVNQLPLRLNLIANNNGVGYFDRETSIGFRVAERRIDEVWDAAERQWVNQPRTGWSTTAEEGVHYRILTPNNRAVFAPGTVHSEIVVETLAANLARGEQRVLILELTDGDTLSPSPNYRWYRIIIRKNP